MNVLFANIGIGNSYISNMSQSIQTGDNLALPTHVPEIISQILLALDYKDLMNTCQTNKDFNEVCQDNYFWKLKVEQDYGTVTEDKPSNITHRQQYFDLMTINNQLWAVEKGRLDILKWLARNNIHLDQYTVNWAAAHGQLKILKWLALTREIFILMS